MKEGVKEIIKVIKKAVLALGELLYIIKDVLVLLLMSILGVSLSQTQNDSSAVILFALILFWLCMVLRQVHNEYKKLMRKEMARKRFTHLDGNGNPSIRTEDLPEIIEYLYRLEEIEDVKPGKDNSGA